MAQTIHFVTTSLAEAFLRGNWEADGLKKRANSILVDIPRRAWISWLVKRVMSAFPGGTAPRTALLVRFLEQDDGVLRFHDNANFSFVTPLEIDLSRLPRPAMQPSPGAAATWNVLPVVTTVEVANWLGVTAAELDWFADRRGREAQLGEGPLRHYRYRWMTKTSGGKRLLEVPKSRLKRIQRKILDDILNKISPHPVAHAYRAGKSIATFVTPHVGKRIVLHIDLREFFPSVRASQIHAIFRTAGYPDQVASILTGLCTNVTPMHVFETDNRASNSALRSKRYGSSHLPQGAPTSPALANLAAYRLDCRLTGLAQKLEASYTRYADDLVFSGGDALNRSCSRFRVLVAAIAHNEGFEIRHRKTREMRSGQCQQVSGIILNQHPNMPRRDYDNFRAILHNCVKHGPASQNHDNHPHFRDHLLGRITYWSTINSHRAYKLKILFQAISWS